MAMPDPNRVIALEAKKIRVALEKLVDLLASGKIDPELRTAKALERIADALEVENRSWGRETPSG